MSHNTTMCFNALVLRYGDTFRFAVAVRCNREDWGRRYVERVFDLVEVA